jgi:hypothetical protein
LDLTGWLQTLHTTNALFHLRAHDQPSKHLRLMLDEMLVRRALPKELGPCILMLGEDDLKGW